MKVYFAIAVLVITITIAKCATNLDKGESRTREDETSTTPHSMEEQLDRLSDNLRKIMTECNDTFLIEMNFLESLNWSGSFPDETDRTPKCFLRCVLEKSEVASTDSQFDVSRTAEVFRQIRDVPHDDIVKIATACSDRPETCTCERSYQYLKCVMEMVIYTYV